MKTWYLLLTLFQINTENRSLLKVLASDLFALKYHCQIRVKSDIQFYQIDNRDNWGEIQATLKA